MTTINWVEKLKSQGFRITKTRREVINQFEKAHQPLSVQELMAIFNKQKRSVNKTTLHREITFLCAQNIIRPVTLQSRKTHYELITDHHHHLVCQQCDKVIAIHCQEIEDNLKALTQSAKKEKKFNIFKHQLEFYGLCESCQS